MKDIDNEKGLAEYLGKPVKTIQAWRWRGEGPPYMKVGASVRYRKSDVDAWLDAQTVHPKEA